ncbi:Uncharacterised protein [[Clostridium] sordellii]|uniref:Uncharacterized protein n=2 Tax=Paraclostridium sordellii TaxID=1505 RepID=A0ABM9RNB3_PARSO|nr:hypothetical protein [Paeniclostridium sordellii]CEJ73535.1 hypothetical protein ATCC9714_14231 [[Clostridium] sordellii] [Paeniclostridium sordellii]CEN69085.1 Uncharacterised protein [[Clostridium] sordellii] [Paeniclostridium sordellii]CEN72353.1 Uncharacterised protein [[Clostridium] sordellii] [Paeniclostridium sordellii]CEO23708.1 Uncharacterised protein [[Clostridium] sordellii] [Paeniclostridium sordellii]CEP76054.1 Uncharacterised protein [[Clostridium] sordellii] [Paeniclostridium
MNINRSYFTILIISLILMLVIIISKSYIYMIGKILLGFAVAFIISSLMNIKKIRLDYNKNNFASPNDM